MRRSFLALASFAFFGSLLLAGDASACCHKKTRCAPACEPVVCAPAPVCEPVACAPKKKCGGMKLFSHMHHKKAACAPACETVAYEAAPVQWVAPSAQMVAPSGQGY